MSSKASRVQSSGRPRALFGIALDDAHLLDVARAVFQHTFLNIGDDRAVTARATAYLHFGGGLHPCAGRVVNAWQIPLLVGTLLRRGIASVGPIAWSGPFPAHMTVRLGARA